VDDIKNGTLPLLLEYNNDKLANRLLGYVDQKNLLLKQDVTNSTSNSITNIYHDINRVDTATKYLQDNFIQDENKLLKAQRDTNFLDDEYKTGEIEIDNKNVNHDVEQIDLHKSLAALDSQENKTIKVDFSGTIGDKNKESSFIGKSDNYISDNTSEASEIPHNIKSVFQLPFTPVTLSTKTKKEYKKASQKQEVEAINEEYSETQINEFKNKLEQLGTNGLDATDRKMYKRLYHGKNSNVRIARINADTALDNIKSLNKK
jgi:hypothetical protein